MTQNKNPHTGQGAGASFQDINGRFDFTLSGGEIKSRKWPRFIQDSTKGFDPEMLKAFQSEKQALIEQHGHETCTRAQTAAHETGHIVVAWALGVPTASARIYPLNTGTPHGTLWVGRCSFSKDFEVDILGRTAVDLAGWEAECFAGLSHPASSYDERFKVRSVCEAIDAADNVGPGKTHAGVRARVLEALHCNRSAFDTIRRHLTANRVLTAKDVARYLAGGVRLGELS